jgi:hypothetical protein
MTTPEMRIPSATPLIDSFMDTLYQLLEGLHDCFPECVMTAQIFANFKSVIMNDETLRRKTIESWHEALKEYYDAFDKHDLARLENSNIPLIGVLRVFDKFHDPDLGDENRQILWEYLEQLNGYAKLHNTVPPSIMSRIASATTAAATQSLASGGAGQALAMPNIQNLAMSVINETNEADMEQFAASMPQIIEQFGGVENILQMASAMQSQMGAMMSANPQAAQMFSQATSALQHIDINEVASMLSGGARGGAGAGGRR